MWKDNDWHCKKRCQERRLKLLLKIYKQNKSYTTISVSKEFFSFGNPTLNGCSSEPYLKWKSKQQSPNVLQALSQKQVLERNLLSSTKHLLLHDWSVEFFSRITAARTLFSNGTVKFCWRSSFTRFFQLTMLPWNFTIKSLSLVSNSGKRSKLATSNSQTTFYVACKSANDKLFGIQTNWDGKFPKDAFCSTD